MPEAFLDPGASRDFTRTWMQDAEREAGTGPSDGRADRPVRTHAEDGSNLAEVTVDSNGVLVDLVLTERTCNFEPPAGARAVMAALREARTKIAEQARDITAEAIGPDSMSARVIGERLREQLESPDDTLGDESSSPTGTSRDWPGGQGVIGGERFLPGRLVAIAPARGQCAGRA